MTGEQLRLGFLASGDGTSARAVIDAVRSGELEAQARLLVTNNRSSRALTFAQLAGLPALCIPTVADPQAADQRLADEMEALGVNLIVLSGYLRRLGPVTLQRFAGRILNIHPGPLPRFGGEGMYGAAVHAAVLASGAAESAIAIHLVDEEYDHGPVVASRPVAVEPGDTAETLQARVKPLEPGFFVQTLQRIAEGDLRLPAA